MDPAVYANMAAVQDRHWWYVGRRRILASELARIIEDQRAEQHRELKLAGHRPAFGRFIP